jgi:hypothetical protein
MNMKLERYEYSEQPCNPKLCILSGMSRLLNECAQAFVLYHLMKYRHRDLLMSMALDG